MTVSDKLYVAIKSQYDKFHDLFVSTTPKDVVVEHVDAFQIP